jgi:hypothetical protein
MDPKHGDTPSASVMSQNGRDETQAKLDGLAVRLDVLEAAGKQIGGDANGANVAGIQMQKLLHRLEDLETALREQHAAIAEALGAMQQSLASVLDSGRLTVPQPTVSQDPETLSKSAPCADSQPTSATSATCPPETPPAAAAPPLEEQKSSTSVVDAILAARPKPKVTFAPAPIKPGSRRTSADGKPPVGQPAGRRRLPDDRKSPLGPAATPISPRIQPTRKSGGAATLAMQAARREMQRAAARAAAEATSYVCMHNTHLHCVACAPTSTRCAPRFTASVCTLQTYRDEPVPNPVLDSVDWTGSGCPGTGCHGGVMVPGLSRYLGCSDPPVFGAVVNLQE